MEKVRKVISCKTAELLKYFELNLHVGSLIQNFKCLYF